MNEIEAKIYSIVSSLTESIIFLEEVNGIRLLPIWIGPIEAQAIAIKISGYTTPRPMTHDLLYKVIKALEAKVLKIVIDDLKENTFFASIYLENKDKTVTKVDSRPSDAIALAVRSGSPIYISEEILNKTQTLAKPITEEEVKEFKEKLKTLTPKDIIGDTFKKGEGGEDDKK